MSGNSTNSVALTIDSKKCRLRVHKAAIHRIGDPSMIQLLVNPHKGLLAIRAPEHHAPKRDKIKVQQQMNDVDDCVEMYSKPLIINLLSAFPALQLGYTYNLRGRVIDSERLVVFPLSSLTRIKNSEGEPHVPLHQNADR